MYFDSATELPDASVKLSCVLDTVAVKETTCQLLDFGHNFDSIVRVHKTDIVLYVYGRTILLGIQQCV